MSKTNRTHPDYLRGAEPYKYTEKYVKEVVRLAEAGKSMMEIGAAFGLGENTMLLWAHTYPLFKKAYSEARLKYKAWLINDMQKGLHDRNYNANIAAILVRHVADMEGTGPLKSGINDVKASINTILDTESYTADQKVKLVQAIETGVRATETADAVEKLEALEDQIKLSDKTRVGKT